MIIKRKMQLPALSASITILSTLIASNLHAMSLQDAYQLASQSDPLLQQAATRFESSEENIIQAKAALRPTVNGQLKADWKDASNTNSSNTKSYAINLSQPVYSPALGSAYNKVKIAQQQAKLQYQLSEQDLVLRTLNAYIAAMIAKSDLTTAQAQERAIQRRLERVNAEFEVGVIAITDVHEAQATYDNTKVSLIISQGQLDNSFEALQRLTDKSVKQVDSLKSSYKIDPLSPSNPQHWIDQAISSNLTILSGKTSIEASQQDIDIAGAALKPSVDLQASHSRENNSLQGTRSDNQIALVLSMPLYNGGSLRSKVRQTMSAQQIEKSKQQDNIRNVTQITRTLIRDIHTNVLAITARKQSIVSSKAALEAVNEGFKVGTRNIVDVLQSEQSLFSAENQYATARLNHIKMLFNLQFQLGKLDKSDITDMAKWMKTEK